MEILRQNLYQVIRWGISFMYFPLIKYLGYSRTESDLGLPTSHYFLGEDSLGSLNQIHKRYLNQTGWIESKNANQSIRNGRYIPWTSYAFTHWIEQRELTDLSMLEFGSGASTVFWAEKFSNVVAIETHSKWIIEVRRVCSKLKNVVVHNLLFDQLETSNDGLKFDDHTFDYFTKDLKFFTELNFSFLEINFELIVKEIAIAHYIFVDGGPRNLYMKLIANFASNEAVVIVDNSDQAYTNPGRISLKESGFREIEFRSLGPLNHSATSTSVFIKNFGSL